MMKILAVGMALCVTALMLVPASVNADTALKVSGASGTYVMEKGTHKQLTANTYASWKSSRKSVVYCSAHGWIKARKKGRATITVQGAGQVEKIKVIVGTRVKKIRISGTSYLSKNRKAQLRAYAAPSSASYKSVSWKSSNKAVATVSGRGVVKGIKGGTVTITATAKDGSKKKAKKKIRIRALKAADTKFIAHRGLSEEAPENSAASFKLAEDYGFYGAECDVWPTKSADQSGDKSVAAADENFRFVISHDNSLERMCGYDKNITDMTADEIDKAKKDGLQIVNGNGISEYGPQELLYLEDYLDIVKASNLTPVIEIKTNGSLEQTSTECAEKLCSIVDKKEMLDRTDFISFSSDKLAAVIKVAADEYGLAPNTFLLGSGKDTEKQVVDRAAAAGMTGVQLKCSLINDEIVSYARNKGLTVGGWTTDNSSVAYGLKQNYDIDEVTTNSLIFD